LRLPIQSISLVECSFAGDADHFPATMGLTLFVIANASRRSRGEREANSRHRIVRL
jgi:hypothetical protein